MKAISRFVLTLTCAGVVGFGTLATTVHAGGNLPAGPCIQKVASDDQPEPTFGIWEEIELAVMALRTIGAL